MTTLDESVQVRHLENTSSNFVISIPRGTSGNRHVTPKRAPVFIMGKIGKSESIINTMYMVDPVSKFKKSLQS